MLWKRLIVLLMLSWICGLSEAAAAVQGGWRQWDVYMRDGTKRLGTPLTVTDGKVSFGIGSDAHPAEKIELSRVDYIAVLARDLPPAPTEEVEQDTVILTDGTRSAGPITALDVKFSEGTFIQNEKKLTLKDVAYIKFAKPKKDSKK
jgi:hypothetical protein